MSISVESLTKESESYKDLLDDIVKSINNLNKLVNEENKDWALGASSCDVLANALRTASVRTPLGESGIIEELSKLLKLVSGEQINFQIQVLRVFGNLCFDHEKNRDRVKNASVIPIVTPYLKSEDDGLVRTVCGFLLNSSMNYVPILNEIANTGAANHLFDLLVPGKEDNGSITMGLKVLDSVVAEEDARKSVATIENVRKLVTNIEYLYTSAEYVDELEKLDSLLDILLQIIMDDDSLQNEIVDMGSLNTLLDFLENSEIELEEKEEKEKLEEIRKTLSKIIIYATSTDSKMDELYNNQQLLERFLATAKNKSEVVHQCAVYILGNLARSDEHCIELVTKYKLSQTLLDIYQTTENATFQYAILGCLKHLCLPVSNKDIIGDQDCIRILSPNLEESKDMLKRNQFLTIGIIKLLCAGNYKNAKKIVEETNTLSLVVDFLRRVDDVAAKSEATRVLTNLVKTIWVQPETDELKNKMIEYHIIDPIIELVRSSTFPILKNDGIMALTLIFSVQEPDSVLNKALSLTLAVPTQKLPASDEEESKEKEKFDDRTFLHVVLDDICNANDIPVQIKCNACVLLCKIVEASKLVKGQKQIIETIQSLGLAKLQIIDENTELYKYSNTLVKTLN